jgi:hypothetical protein
MQCKRDNYTDGYATKKIKRKANQQQSAERIHSTVMRILK